MSIESHYVRLAFLMWTYEALSLLILTYTQYHKHLPISEIDWQNSLISTHQLINSERVRPQYSMCPYGIDSNVSSKPKKTKQFVLSFAFLGYRIDELPKKFACKQELWLERMTIWKDSCNVWQFTFGLIVRNKAIWLLFACSARQAFQYRPSVYY